MANLYKNETITSSRVNVFLGWEHFNPKGNVAPGRMDQNLCGRLWRQNDRSAIDMAVMSCKGPMTNLTRDTLDSLKFQPASIGDKFGPTFTTHLFRLRISVPDKFVNRSVHLIWDSNTEAMVLSSDGTPLQGLVGGNHWARRADFPLFPNREKSIACADDLNHAITLYVEISCNGLFGAGRGGDIEPPDMKRYYTLEECSLAVFDHDAWSLIHDVTFLQGASKHLEKDSPRRVRALQIANDIINTVDVSDPSTYEKGREIAKKGFLNARNGEAQSLVSAMLHSHIDLAWLWPMAATPAKGARTFSSALRLLETYPESLFVQSQAQLYAWVRDRYPTLWEGIRAMVKQGRFIPVGGTWVEMDCNIPSGEALVRQFVHGQKFFQSEFGIRCREFWLPDTFGYAAQLPQIMKQCNIDFFLTQKLSWNTFNKFPHSSFVWEGLDGSSVLAHMPPAETYNSQAFPEEVLKSARGNRDVAVFDNSMLLVGHGDGGGGASPAMLESLRRMRDVDGIPRVEFRSPVEFFTMLNDKKDCLPRWVGELYFELHRGTYTSQAYVKKCNRDCELLLTQVETCASIARLVTNSNFVYPREALDEAWKRVLKNAFHDTLPGSCIGMVYKETKTDYDFVRQFCMRARADAIAAVLEGSTSSASDGSSRKKLKAANGDAVDAMENGNGTTCTIRNEHTGDNIPLVALSTGPIYNGGQGDVRIIELNKSVLNKVRGDFESQKVVSDFQIGDNNDTIMSNNDETTTDEEKILVAAKGLRQGSYGMCQIQSLVPKSDGGLTPVTVTTEQAQVGGGIRHVLHNGMVRVTVEPSGRLSSVKLFDKEGKRGREAIRADGEISGNHLVICDDVPMFWEAWDLECYNLEKHQAVGDATEVEIVESGPLQGTIRIQYSDVPWSKGSTISQLIRLRAGSARIDFDTTVDWRGSRKCLRVLFDCGVRAAEATYDSQFGFVRRTTTFNTSWDVAKFEVVAHRFCDLSEHGFGVTLMSDSKYGYSVRDSVMRMSLLRAPKSPDDEADMGVHRFTYSFMPHADAFPNIDVFKEAQDLNEPMVIQTIPRDKTPPKLFAVRMAEGHPEAEITSLGVSCFKQTEEKSDDADELFVLRVYEQMGGRGMAVIEVVGGVVRDVQSCNMLEDVDDKSSVEKDGDGRFLKFEVRPFQIFALAHSSCN